MTYVRPVRWALVGLAVLVALMSSAGTGLADAGPGMPEFVVSVDEAASDDAVWQGDEWTIVVTVTNQGDELGTQEVVVAFGDASMLERTAEARLEAGGSLSAPETRELTLEPGESRTLELTPTVPERVEPGTATATVLTADDSGRLEGTVGDASVEVDPAVSDDTGWSEVIVRLEPLNLQGIEDPERVLKAHAETSQADLLALAQASEALEVQNTFWLANGVVLEVDHDRDGLLLASTADHVTRIHENFEVTADNGTAEATATSSSSADTTWGLSEINAPAVWDQYGTQGSGARVAVLDTGIDVDHPDLDLFTQDPNDPTYPGGWAEWDDDGNRIEGSAPHDNRGHGTHVSGTVSGGDASGTHIGVAPDVELLHGKVLDTDGGTFAQVLSGMEWAAERDADVTSMSLGSAGYKTAYMGAIHASHALETYVVTSIGNDGEGVSGSPGNEYEALAIGASNSDHEISSFSSGEEIVTDDAWGDDAPDAWPASFVVPDVAAPGAQVLSSVPGGYDYLWGTSMATPHVSGTVALILSAHPHLDIGEVEEALVETAWKPAGEPSNPDNRYGEGIIDAKAALDYASEHFTGLDVEVEGTNSPVTEGERLNATVQVTNVGGVAASQAIRLEDFQGNAMDTEEVTLGSGETTEVNLTWETESGDAGFAELQAASEDLDDAELVRVFDADGGCHPRHPVNIPGDYAFTAANGVTRGQGTAEDPYVVERWCIDAEADTPAALLDSTTAHVELRGNDLSNSYQGVTLEGAENVTVVDNTIQGNADDGIWLFAGAHGNTIHGNEITSNAGDGVLLSSGATANTVRENLVEGNGDDGFTLLDPADSNTLAANTIQDNSDDGIWTDAPSTAIRDNEILANGDDGLIVASGAVGTEVTNNRIAENPDNGVWADSADNRILDNTVTRNDDGLILSSDATRNTVTRNAFTDNANDGVRIFGTDHDVGDNEIVANEDDGLVLSSGASGNDVTGNSIAENVDNGLWVDSADNRLLDNTVTRNDDGLVLSSDATRNTVTGNAFTGNADDGIWLFGTDNEIAENAVRGNAETGIGFSSSATGNALTWNRIAQNGWGLSVFGTADNTIERNEILRNEHNGASVNDLDDPLDLTHNAWGDPSGPSGGTEDCQTGAQANGDGDDIDADGAEVCFDPWLSPWFVVSIEDTNAPVLPGEDLEVTVEVENTWDRADTQAIRLEDFGDETVDRIGELTLDPGESVTDTLVWETDVNSWGLSEVTVVGESHADEETVTVLPDPLAG